MPRNKANAARLWYGACDIDPLGVVRAARPSPHERRIKQYIALATLQACSHVFPSKQQRWAQERCQVILALALRGHLKK